MRAATPTKLVGTVRRRARLVSDRRSAARLRTADNATARAAGAAIDSVIAREATAAEAAWMRRLDQLRRELDSSTLRLESRLSEFTGDPRDSELLVGEVGDLSRKASKPPMWAYLLFRLVREHRPERALELGTCLGLSAAHQAAALEVNGAGQLVTLEAAASRAEIAARNLERLGLSGRAHVVPGRFQDTLQGVLEGFDGPVDYAFIDGHHDEDATLIYFEQILPFASEGALLVFDDVAWSDGMARAWRALQAHSRTALSVDLGNVGLCAVGEGGPGPSIRIRLDARKWSAPGSGR